MTFPFFLFPFPFFVLRVFFVFQRILTKAQHVAQHSRERAQVAAGRGLPRVQQLPQALLVHEPEAPLPSVRAHLPRGVLCAGACGAAPALWLRQQPPAPVPRLPRAPRGCALPAQRGHHGAPAPDALLPALLLVCPRPRRGVYASRQRPVCSFSLPQLKSPIL